MIDCSTCMARKTCTTPKDVCFNEIEKAKEELNEAKAKDFDE